MGAIQEFFIKKFECYYLKNQKRGRVRLIFVFLFLEEGVWGRTGLGFVSKKYNYFLELNVSGDYKRLDLTS